ncbi:guanine nucleotide-binding protein subunit beta-like protein 1 [Cimex lectularius]|uniref:Guanine nucleotide-binding protein subunit beta-like protein 1 n=1 Tax=Cimex lectularius TaxID=79782 RepID=A0A8I6S7B3_CIMLE|nr:guanine nucleotide-binding protein subunit beta-like protein 1 [Cimex lectularius]XP_014260326.1 guanine nucleotide-binding protein subunit beta-like protein 1 [Cimex lectularius]
MVKPTTPSSIYSFRGGESLVHCLLLDLNGSKEVIYVGTNDGCVNIWDLKISRTINSVKISNEPILAVLINGNHFITQEKGECIKFWDEEMKSVIKQLSYDYVGFCKIVSRGDYLVYPLSEGRFTVYNIKTEVSKVVGFKFNKKPGEVMCLFCLENDKVLVLYEGGFLALWDFDGVKLSECEIGDTPMCMDFCEATQEGVVGTSGLTLVKFKLDEGLDIANSAQLTNPGVSALAVHKSGRIFVAGCWDGSVKYFNMSTMQLLAVITSRPSPIQSLVFSHKTLSQWGPAVVFVAGPDQKVSLCNLYSKELSE